MFMYLGWLLAKRKVQASTVEKYLAGVRVAHLKAGFMVPALRPDIVQTVLAGAANRDGLLARLKNKAPRLAVTLTVMELIKCKLTNSKRSLSKKRLIWLVSCLCFNGSFRQVHPLESIQKSK